MALKYQDIKQAHADLETLLALGQYEAESEMLKDYLRELQSRYQGHTSLKELRQRMDEALGSQELSEVLRQMREEETH